MKQDQFKSDRFRPEPDSFNETEIVASATECTGLMPALNVDAPDLDENIARLYAIHAPDPKENINAKERKKEQGKERKNEQSESGAADCGHRRHAGHRAADRRNDAAHAHP